MGNFYASSVLSVLLMLSSPAEYEQKLLELQFDYQQKVNVVEALKMEMRQLLQSRLISCVCPLAHMGMLQV